MKSAPITGTIALDNAPPAITAAPYVSSQIPGKAVYHPARKATAVKTAPAMSDGKNASASFRAMPRVRGDANLCDFRSVNDVETLKAVAAEAIHTINHRGEPKLVPESAAAAHATIPVAAIPFPESAVKTPARSIVSRIKRTLSMARSDILGGSGSTSRCSSSLGNFDMTRE
jgi:hypothetical protein